MNKIVIVGLDGVPYRLMEKFSNEGIMPNFKSLREKGMFKKMASAIPDISSVSWSSIITGKNPGEHNIFGFTELIDNSYSLSFPNFANLRAKTFWQRFPDKKYVIINVPSTYPAQEINGVLISGFVSLDLDKAVYPRNFVNKLKEIDYQIDVDAQIAHSSKKLFMEKLFDVLEKRIVTYRYLWERAPWDVFMFVITGTDRIGHFFWDAYEDETHKFHKDFLNYFKRIDEIIGEIANKLDETDNLIMLSDHGMELSKININLNYFLQQKGFLSLDTSKESYNKISAGSVAFALDPGRIYLNKEEKYPFGCVKKEDREKIIQKLISEFENLEKDGQKVIDKIFRKENIYSGPYLEKAPDLVLLSKNNFNLKGNIERDCLFEKDNLSGKHTQSDAFLFVMGKNQNKVPENPSVEDFVSLLGLEE